MNAPCMNCPDRAIGCHGHCERYKAFREGREKEYAFRHEQYILEKPTPVKERNIRRSMILKARGMK